MTTSEGSERGIMCRNTYTQFFVCVTTQKHAAVRRDWFPAFFLASTNPCVNPSVIQPGAIRLSATWCCTMQVQERGWAGGI